jgi:inosose dehydratase
MPASSWATSFPRTAPALKAKLAEFDLACVSGWYSGFLAEDSVEAEIARCRAHMAKLQFNGAKVVVYGECAGTIQGQIDTPLARRPRFTGARSGRPMANGSTPSAPTCSRPMASRWPTTTTWGPMSSRPQDIDQLMAVTDPAAVGLLFDTGHAWFGGAGDPVALLRKHMNARGACALQGRARRRCRAGAQRRLELPDRRAVRHFTVPGDGAIDFDAVLTALHAPAYEGWLVVEAEQDPAVAPSYQYASKGLPPCAHRRAARPATVKEADMVSPLLVKARPRGATSST